MGVDIEELTEEELDGFVVYRVEVEELEGYGEGLEILGSVLVRGWGLWVDRDEN